NFALLSLVFLIGLWLGLIYRRFGLTGSVVAYGILTLIVVAAVMLITWEDAWSAFWNAVVNLDILAASGLVLLAGVVVAIGGYLTIRRITV
ncbi:MAG: hypothetical protein ABWZ98_14700, partial [Nakamurella sp.]